MKVGPDKYVSSAAKLHAQFRKSWDDVHRLQRDLTPQDKLAKSEGNFKQFLRNYGHRIDRMGFKLPRLHGTHLYEFVQSMTESVGGLDGYFLRELKALPFSFWELRAQIENLGEV